MPPTAISALHEGTQRKGETEKVARLGEKSQHSWVKVESLVTTIILNKYKITLKAQGLRQVWETESRREAPDRCTHRCTRLAVLRAWPGGPSPQVPWRGWTEPARRTPLSAYSSQSHFCRGGPTLRRTMWPRSHDETGEWDGNKKRILNKLQGILFFPE